MSSPETDPQMLHAFASDADGPDASARVLRERHLGRATLLAAVEELARSIAHDINQPLGALLMTAKACRRGWENGSLSQEQIQQALERIAADAQRATEILARFRTATRRQGVVLAPTDVNAAIQQALAVTGDELALLGIAPMVNLSLNLPPARADRLGLEQAILGLIAHACEAVTTGPRSSPLIAIRSSMAGTGEIVVEVQDSGLALTAEEIGRIFDPFTTTRRGTTGLELAVSRAMIEEFDGRIWAVASERGVTFGFALALAEIP